MTEFNIEPIEGWHPGDKAYCLKEARGQTRILLEKGRVYHVEDVLHIKGMMPCGLKIKGIDADGEWGFWSSRFVKINDGRPMQRLREQTSRKWHDAYKTSASNKLHQITI